MLISAMGMMMESMSAPSVHHLSPPRPRRARGLARQVYRQMRRDFMVASPFVLHGQVPELLAASWCVVRETLFTGEISRGEKEIVAWAVSEANRCPFCVGAHHAAVRASGASDGELEGWATATGTAHDPRLVSPPFTEHRAEYFGTAVAFHYLNRMVSVFLDDKMMPVPDFMDRMTAAMATVMMGGMIRKGRRNAPGRALEILPDHEPDRAWTPSWAAGHETIGAALAGWSGTIETVARQQLDPALLDAVGAVIEAWEGEPLDLAGDALEAHRPALPEAHRAAGDLALLVAMAPYRAESAVEAVREAGYTEEQVLTLVSWAAQRAARRSGDWIAAAVAERPAEVLPRDAAPALSGDASPAPPPDVK